MEHHVRGVLKGSLQFLLEILPKKRQTPLSQTPLMMFHENYGWTIKKYL